MSGSHTTEPADSSDEEPPPSDRAFFGHPRGLLTLFGAEMWERFSWMGMQAILVLYFADSLSDGGMGFGDSAASSISAAYGTLVYLLAVVGGWLADRVLGSYRSVLYGGILIACGHYSMAVPSPGMTWVGLGLIVVGTGLLKPNVSAMVGKLYSTADDRRDAGFSLYYMGINLGSMLGQIVTGYLGQNEGYHWGFSAAAVGMTFGIAQYVLGRRGLTGRKQAEYPLAPRAMRRALGLVALGVTLLALLALALWLAGALSLTLAVDGITLASVIAPIVYFVVMFRSPRTEPAERQHLKPYLVLFGASVVFNMILFQSGNVLNLLARDHARTSFFGWHFPSTWYQSVLPVVEVLAAPLVAGAWQKLGHRQPHATNKIASSLLLSGASFLLLVPAVAGQHGTWRMAAYWLIAVYVLIGVGDILLQTTGMSTATKLAPKAFSSQTMALWMLSLALAQGIQAQVVRLYGTVTNVAYFGVTGVVTVLLGVAMLTLSPWMRRTMHPVR